MRLPGISAGVNIPGSCIAGKPESSRREFAALASDALFEDDHLARIRALTQAVERVLELVESDPPIDEPIDRQASVEVELRVAREVDRRFREAVVRAENRRLPSTNGYTSNDASTPNGVIPTSTAVPPSGRAWIASSIVSRRPIASKT